MSAGRPFVQSFLIKRVAIAGAKGPNTPNLLAAEGIGYVCDWGNDEQPYRMTPKSGELYSLGVNAYLDDNYIHLHGRRTIDEVNLLWREWFAGLYADGAATGRLMVLHLHPWIMGQPWRIRHLDEVLGHICARQGVWRETGGQIIDWFKAQTHPVASPSPQAGEGQGGGAAAPLSASLPPGRFDYAPINDRPIIRWPNNARLAFWVAPNMEFFEYRRRTGRPNPTSHSIRAWITATASASGACSTCCTGTNCGPAAVST
jgi:hypothetical protein